VVRHTQSAVLAAVLLVATALSACTSSGPASSTPVRSARPSASDSPGVTSAQDKSADALALALQDQLVSQNYTREPRHGFRPSYDGLPEQVYARISAVSTSPDTVTFDCCQLYFGRDADIAARRAGESEPPSPVWACNRYRLDQTLAVHPDAAVILQTAMSGREGDLACGGRRCLNLTSVSFPEFAQRFAEDPLLRGADAEAYGGYILTWDQDGFSSIVQVPFP